MSPRPLASPLRRRAFAAAGAVAAVSAALGGRSAAGQSPAAGVGARPAVAVEIKAAQRGRAERLYRTVGEIVAVQEVQIASQTAGIVERLLFDDSAAVDAGAPLVQLDDRSAQAALSNAAAQRDLHRQNLARVRDLASRGLQPTVDLERETAALAAAESDFRLRSVQLDMLTLRAPFAGTLTERQISVGAFVSPGMAIATLRNLDRIRVRFRLPQRLLSAARAGQTLRVESNLAPGGAVETRVSVVEPVVDEATRMVRVLAEIDNRQRLLRPGSFARVALVLSVEEDAVLVPTEAIVPSISGPYVFVVADGIARRAGVSVGERQGGLTHVLHGVEAGVQVVSQGQFKVQDGSPVLSAVPGGA